MHLLLKQSNDAVQKWLHDVENSKADDQGCQGVCSTYGDWHSNFPTGSIAPAFCTCISLLLAFRAAATARHCSHTVQSTLRAGPGAGRLLSLVQVLPLRSSQRTISSSLLFSELRVPGDVQPAL